MDHALPPGRVTVTVADERDGVPSPRKVAIGALLLSAANACRLALQFLMFPLLARLLEPADFGVMALAMPVALFALTIADGGLGPSLLRDPEDDGPVCATVGWTAITGGIAMTLLLMVAAVPIAAGLSHAEVAAVLAGLAPIVLLNAICTLPSVRVLRTGATWIFALGDIASAIAGIAVALYGALNGWAVWSLVAQQLALWIVKAGLLQALAGGRFRGRPSRTALVYLMGHGLPLVGANLLTLFAASIDNLLIGRLLGVAQLGVYALAYQIVRIPDAVLVSPLLVSFLPAVARLDDRATAAHLLDTWRVIFGLVAPLMLGLALVADQLVALLLGPRWFGAADLLRLLAPAAIAQAMGFVAVLLLLGRGRSGLRFAAAVMNAVLMAGGVLAGTPFGLVGIATGVALAACAGSATCMVVALREMDLGIGALLRVLWPGLAAVALMGSGVAATRALLPHGLPLLVALGISVGAGAAIYVTALQLLSPGALGAWLASFRSRS